MTRMTGMILWGCFREAGSLVKGRKGYGGVSGWLFGRIEV